MAGTRSIGGPVKSPVSFFLSAVLVALIFSPAVPAREKEKEPESLALLEGEAGENISAPPGARIWQVFGEGDRLAAVISLPDSSRRLLADYGPNARILDRPPAGEMFFLVTSPRGTELSRLAEAGEVVWSDAHVALVRTSQESADRLAGEGMEIMAVLPPPPRRRAPSRETIRLLDDPPGEDPLIREIIDEIDQDSVYWMIGNLSGENSVTIDGSPYTIQTRNSYQEEGISKATLYGLEFLSEQGLSASFHEYTWNSYNWRNVFAVQTGAVNPDRIQVICAHIDDQPNASVAPGADDNASGSAAVMLAAQVLSAYRFEDTIRYVLFTGEEQGKWGSYYYVQDCAATEDDIRSVINLDMIAFSSDGVPWIELHCGTTVLPESLAIGELFGDTIDRYDLSLDWVAYTADSLTASDHHRFWNAGYPAIMGIEDTWVGATIDWNPFYHTVSDTRSNCNLPYATEFTRAAVGTLARLAGPLPTPSPTATLPPTPTPSPTPVGLILDARVFLEGPYSGESMSTALRSAGYIPLISPYADAREVSAIPAGTVDWIFLQLRETSSGVAVSTRSAFLKSDGSLMDAGGQETAWLPMPAGGEGDYYIVVRHRDHLDIMSSAAHSLGSSGSATYYFTTGEDKAWGTGPMKEISAGVFGLFAGDADQDGEVAAADYIAAFDERDRSEYLDTDVNLSGVTDSTDRITIFNNWGAASQVP